MKIRKLIKSDGTEVLQFLREKPTKVEIYYNLPRTIIWGDIPVIKEKNKVIKKIGIWAVIFNGEVLSTYDTKEKAIDWSKGTGYPIIRLTGTYEVE